MSSFRYLAASFAAVALIQNTGAWDIKLPPCIEPFRPFVYSGCFVGSDALVYRSNADSKTMTQEKCMAECKGNGYRYAGIEYYGRCACGATVNSPIAEESKCNLPCNGNKTEICGGNKHFSVFLDPTFPPREEVEIDDYVPLGCYTDDSKQGRALSWRMPLEASTLTTEKCLDACKAQGYPFAGTEFGGECYCGVVTGNFSTPTTGCDKPCKGNTTQICGGSSKLSLYVAKELRSLEPCGFGGGNPPPVSSSTTRSTSSSSTISTSSTASTVSTSSTASTVSTSSTISTVSTSSTASTVSTSSTASTVSTSSTISTVSTSSTASTISTSSTASTVSTSSTISTVSTSSTASTFSTSSTASTVSTSSTASTSSTVSTVSTISSSSTGSTQPPATTTTRTSSTRPPVISSSSTCSTQPPATTTTRTSSTRPPAPTTRTSSTRPPVIRTSSTCSTQPPATTTTRTSSTRPPAPTTTRTSSTRPPAPTTTRTSSTRPPAPTTRTSSTRPPVIRTSSTCSTQPPATTTTRTSATRPPVTTPSTKLSTTRPPVTTSMTTTTRTSSSALCTSTIIVPSKCEYGCGEWCSDDLPEWDDEDGCKDGHSRCKLQVSSCFMTAGWPDASACFGFSAWCKDLEHYCDEQDKHTFGLTSKCSKHDWFKVKPPKGGKPPVTTTTVVPCGPTTRPPVPEPTNICKEVPNPIGGIEMPVVTCNDLESDWKSGYVFKLFKVKSSPLCPKYKRPSIGDACEDACEEQYEECEAVYVEGSKENDKPGWSKDKFFGGWWKREEVASGDSYFAVSARNNGDAGVQKRTFGKISELGWKDKSKDADYKCWGQYQTCLKINKKIDTDAKCKKFGQGW